MSIQFNHLTSQAVVGIELKGSSTNQLTIAAQTSSWRLASSVQPNVLLNTTPINNPTALHTIAIRIEGTAFTFMLDDTVLATLAEPSPQFFAGSITISVVDGSVEISNFTLA